MKNKYVGIILLSVFIVAFAVLYVVIHKSDEGAPKIQTNKEETAAPVTYQAAQIPKPPVHSDGESSSHQ